MALPGPAREIIVEPIEIPDPREIPVEPAPAEEPVTVPVEPEKVPA